MRTVEEIKSIIRPISCPETGYNFIDIDSYLWGKNQCGDIAFGFYSKNTNVLPLRQATRHLKLFINNSFRIIVDGVVSDKKLSLLVLKEIDDRHLDVFIRMALSMIGDLDEDKLLKYFMELRDLFSNEKKISKNELEGLFGELFAMYVLKTCYRVDISMYYQREDRRKFDFNLSDSKKIEIKTTLRPERVHHFLQQQLDTDRYEIRVISLMLQKDDAGMSLLDLANKCKELFSNHFMVVLHLEMITKNIDDSELEDIKFNYSYAKDNMRIYDARKMPRLKEKDIEGVFNVEYDVDLVNTQSETPASLIDWINRVH